MAVPLLDEERVLGVLQVLDRPQEARFSLQEMELLGLFATQAAIALSLLATARSARAALAGDAPAAVVADLAGTLDSLEGESRLLGGRAAAQPHRAVRPPARLSRPTWREPRRAGLSWCALNLRWD